MSTQEKIIKMDNQSSENNTPQEDSEKTENVFEVVKKSKIPNWVSWVVLAVVILIAGGAVWYYLLKPQSVIIDSEKDYSGRAHIFIK